MLIDRLVFVECLLCLQTACHLLLVVLNPLGVGRHQGLLAVLQTKESVLHLLCRDEIVALHNLLVVVVDAGLDLVKFHVDVTGHHALALGAATLGFPYLRVTVHLATELALRAVHRDTSHHRIGSILLQLLPLEVENHRISTFRFFSNFTKLS